MAKKKKPAGAGPGRKPPARPGPPDADPAEDLLDDLLHHLTRDRDPRVAAWARALLAGDTASGTTPPPVAGGGV